MNAAPPVLRAAIYTRVSSDPTGRARSVAEQLVECRQVAVRNGWQVVTEFEDNDRSASRYARQTRPAFAALAEAIAGHQFDVLLTWEASRLQRDLAAYVALRDLCRKHHVSWCYSGALIDLDNPEDSFRAGLDAVLAERESDVTRARIMRSVRANVAAGRPHGKLLWGYRREYDPITRALVAQTVDPAIGPILRDMATRVLAGESGIAIARDLNARGIPSPRAGAKGWTSGQVHRTLRNPSYGGMRHHHGTVTGPGTWEPMFDELTFRRLQALLTDPSRLTQHGSAAKHLLSGLADCALCDAPLRMLHNRGRYWAYTCSTGFHVTMSEHKLDQVVVDALLRRLRRPGTRILAPDDTAHDALLEAARERARLAEFAEQAADGHLSASTLARVEQKILARVAELERTGRRPMPDVVHSLTGPDNVAVWKDLPITKQRLVIAACMRPQLAAGRRGERGINAERVGLGWR